MRISELAEASGVPLPTVKYYLREGLLPPGEQVNARRSDYGPGHVRRLRLLRVLREVGDVPVQRLRDVVAAVDDETRSRHAVLAAAAEALAPVPPPPVPGTDERRDAARHLARRVVADAGWDTVGPDWRDMENLAAALEVVGAWVPAYAERAGLRRYAAAADTLGRDDVASLDGAASPAETTERMVVGQVVMGEVLLVLRRLAQAHHSARR